MLQVPGQQVHRRVGGGQGGRRGFLSEGQGHRAQNSNSSSSVQQLICLLAGLPALGTQGEHFTQGQPVLRNRVGAEVFKLEPEPIFFTRSRSQGKMARLRNTGDNTNKP